MLRRSTASWTDCVTSAWNSWQSSPPTPTAPSSASADRLRTGAGGGQRSARRTTLDGNGLERGQQPGPRGGRQPLEGDVAGAPHGPPDLVEVLRAPRAQGDVSLEL